MHFGSNIFFRCIALFSPETPGFPWFFFLFDRTKKVPHISMRVFVPRNVARWVHCHRYSLPTLSWRNFRENHRELLCFFFGGPFESLFFFEPSIDLLIFMMVAKLVIHDGFSNVKSWLCMLQRTIWQTTQTPKKVPVPDVQPIQWLQRHHWFLLQPRILHSHAGFTSKI